MATTENLKKHPGRNDLIGEHKFGDTGQLILFILFSIIWIGDSFIFNYSTFLITSVSLWIRILVSGSLILLSLYLAIAGMKIVFGQVRETPEVIHTGVFKIMRHPIYTSALMLYFSLTFLTMSIMSAGIFIIIIIFYHYISRYEEKILTQYFGEEYTSYKKSTGMWFPKITL